MDQTQTKAETVAFRVPADTKLMMQAVAVRRGEMLSDWLRRIANEALKRELAPE